MMDPAKDRMRNNVSEPLDRARAGRILPERNMRSHLVIMDNHCSHPSLERAAKCSVIITDEIFGRRVPRECFGDLARQPLRGWVLGHRKPQQLPPRSPHPLPIALAAKR
jgi:hypothetical protein